MNVISILTPDEVKGLGVMPPESIYGQLQGEKLLPEFFQVNSTFVNFLHKVIGEKAIYLPSIINAAKIHKDGYLYIIDFRTPEGPMGNVPNEDIIGAFKIENGELVKDSYWKNNSHKILTKNGIMKLHPEMKALLVSELKLLSY